MKTAVFNNKLIKYIIKKLFPFYDSKEIKELFKILQGSYSKDKKVAMFVGGCVRKHLENEDIDDIDIATIYTPDELKNLFKDTNVRLVETGVEHGSVTLFLNKIKFEVTTLRKDLKTDGRHAQVSYTDDWQIDSNRRDFTINSIYMNQKGKIFDPQSGLSDLKNKIVKFIGDPAKRIEEDYLRIIRFIRFTIQYNSELEIYTNDVIKLNLNNIKNISKERILNELFKIISLKNFKNILKNKNIKKIFSLIFPELKYLDRLEKISLLSKNFKLKNYLILSIMLLDHTNNHEYFCHKYKVSNEINKKLKLFADFVNKYHFENNNFRKDLLKNTYFYGKDNLKNICTLLYFFNKKFNLEELLKVIKKIEKISIPSFPYDGNYLKKMGHKEGKEIGFILKKLEIEWIENNFTLGEESLKQIIKNPLIKYN